MPLFKIPRLPNLYYGTQGTGLPLFLAADTLYLSNTEPTVVSEHIVYSHSIEWALYYNPCLKSWNHLLE